MTPERIDELAASVVTELWVKFPITDVHQKAIQAEVAAVLRQVEREATAGLRRMFNAQRDVLAWYETESDRWNCDDSEIDDELLEAEAAFDALAAKNNPTGEER